MQTTPIKQENGKYRWRYEMSLWKNPSIFFTVAKAILLAVGITIFLIALISLIADGFSADKLAFVGKLTLIMLGIFVGLLLISYPIYAAVMGGKYIVDFTMDDNELCHEQIAEQAKKARGIGAAAAVAGMLTHNRGAISAGAAAQRTSSTIQLGRIKKVTVNKKRSTIKIHSFGWDQVYADGDDFDFVVEHIRARAPETAKWVVK